MITKARKDAPRSPSEFNPSCSKNLDRIALKAIQKDLELRYRNAGEFLDELSEEFTEMKKKDAENKEKEKELKDRHYATVVRMKRFLEKMNEEIAEIESDLVKTTNEKNGLDSYFRR